MDIYSLFGGFFTSSGLFISDLIWVMGKQLYISHEHEGQIRKSCSDSVISYVIPQSTQTYFPGPTFDPAFTLFCSVIGITNRYFLMEPI